jgi:hypothetical protein
MKLAIMQPYFLPYIGYFQLIAAVDVFVVYDNIKYTKKGWINRNRMLSNGAAATFSLPLRSDSDLLDVRDRELSADFDRRRLLNRFEGAYRNAPQFAPTFELVKRIVNDDHTNLFDYILHSLIELCAYLQIETEIRVSSTVDIDHTLRGQDKVLALCKALGATEYLNASGGTELYSVQQFAANGIELGFLRSSPVEYAQGGAEFIPWLSMIDVLMFNPPETVRDWVSTKFVVG